MKVWKILPPLHRLDGSVTQLVPLTRVPCADQLQELRKVTLASILCENLDEVYMVQPDVFIAADPYLNSPVTCDVFPR